MGDSLKTTARNTTAQQSNAQDMGQVPQGWHQATAGGAAAILERNDLQHTTPKQRPRLVRKPVITTSKVVAINTSGLAAGGGGGGAQPVGQLQTAVTTMAAAGGGGGRNTLSSNLQPVNEQPAAEQENPCPQLFDPCTREPLANLVELEQKVRQIKRAQSDFIISQRKFPLDMKLSRMELLLFILNQPTKPTIDILEYNTSYYLFEALWDIVISFGLIADFPINDNFFLFNAKAEEIRTIEDPRFTNDRLQYLKQRKINEGASGVSDITFLYRERLNNHAQDDCSFQEPEEVGEPQLYYCSSKYYKNDARKGVDKFDIQNIVAAAKNLSVSVKIVLLVKNKEAVQKILKNALRRYIADEASYVFGVDDLLANLTRLYDTAHEAHNGQFTEEIIKSIFNLESTPKPILNLRLHQHIAVDGISDAIANFRTHQDTNNKFLVGIVPRGGKTYIAGGLIYKLQPKNVVVLLGAKSETLKQFKDELFDLYDNFSAYTCIDVRDEVVEYEIDPTKKYIFIMSVELYKKQDTTRTLIQNMKTGRLPIELFICDEAHLKQTTKRAAVAVDAATAQRNTRVVGDLEEEEEPSEVDEVNRLRQLDKVIGRYIPVVYMTGTYIKPLTAFRIPMNHVVLWDYQDIQMAKQISEQDDYFKENFGSLYTHALQTCLSYGETLESIEAQYKKFPELYLLTTQFSQEAKQAFSAQETGGAPTLLQYFQVRKDFDPATTHPNLWYTGFTNPVGVMRLLNYLCPTNQIVDLDGAAVEPIPSVMKTIDYIAQSIGDRLGFFTTNFVTHSQLWFLPSMRGHPLKKRLCALAGAIFQLPWFRQNFDVLGVSSSVDWNSVSVAHNSRDSKIEISGRGGAGKGVFSWRCDDARGLKTCLINYEMEARQRGKGLIILAQNMLQVGISLKCVDIVVLLDEGKKVDERIQKMYRALTESTNKKGGYIVDMNYFRTVVAMMNYSIAVTESRTGHRVYEHNLTEVFNQVLNTYSFDITIPKPLFETEVHKTFPEIQRLLGRSRVGSDSIVITNAAQALNQNVLQTVGNDYNKTYDEFLGAVHNSFEKRRILRKNGNNVKRAEEVEPAAAGGGGGAAENTTDLHDSNNDYVPDDLNFINPNATEEQKRDAFIDIFRTTLKLGIFASNSTRIEDVIEKIKDDIEFQTILFDTLVTRGIILENTQYRDIQQRELVSKLILPGLEKMVATEKNNSYRGMKEAVNDERKYPAEVTSVLDYINIHLAPKGVEVHKYGEVFTPISLVEKMLDTLPAEVWNDKSLKWLDPANGMGNFPIAVFLRLFYGFRTKDGKFNGLGEEGEGKYNPGLTREIPNDDARKKHIVKDMLYMVELNTKNNAIAKRLFTKLAPGVEPNIIQHSRTEGFLSNKPFEFPNGKVQQFDIIMGNPPFQGGAVRGKTTNKTRKMREELDVGQDKHKNLWIPFVKKILSTHLKKNGLLLFIHPIGWFKPDRTGIHEEMLKYQIHHITIYFIDESKRLFQGSGEINTAFYLLENKPISSSTKIINIYKEIESVKLNKDSIIILAHNTIFSKIQNKSKLFYQGNDLKGASIDMKKCTHGANKQIHRFTEDGQITYMKTAVEHPYQNESKLILSGYKSPRFYFDKTGEYGLIGSHQQYFIGEKLSKLEEYFKTKLSALLLANIKYDQKFIEPKYYPDVRELQIDRITDETLADYFGFTKDERDAISKTEYPKREYKFKEVTCAQLKGQKGGFKSERYNRTRKNKRT
jgi:hypothetical protein